MDIIEIYQQNVQQLKEQIMEKGDLMHAIRESKKAKDLSLPLTFWEDLPHKLQKPDAILLDTTQKKNALFFIYYADQAKVVVAINYKIKNKGISGGRSIINILTTGTKLLSERQEKNLKAFKVLYGKLK